MARFSYYKQTKPINLGRVVAGDSEDGAFSLPDPEPDAFYHPDCPACLRGRPHSAVEHETALTRVREASRA